MAGNGQKPPDSTEGAEVLATLSRLQESLRHLTQQMEAITQTMAPAEANDSEETPDA